MAYEKQTWVYGDKITADKLNHIENGIASASSGGGGTAPLIVEITKREATTEECSQGGTVAVFSHSWQEMYDAFMAGRAVILDTTELFDMAPDQSFSAVTEFFTENSVIFFLSFAKVESVAFRSPTSKTFVQCSVQ